MDLPQLCHEREDSYVVFPELRHFGAIHHFCSSLGAEMAAPETPEENYRLVNATTPFRELEVRVGMRVVIMRSLFR